MFFDLQMDNNSFFVYDFSGGSINFLIKSAFVLHFEKYLIIAKTLFPNALYKDVKGVGFGLGFGDPEVGWQPTHDGRLPAAATWSLAGSRLNWPAGAGPAASSPPHPPRSSERENAHMLLGSG